MILKFNKYINFKGIFSKQWSKKYRDVDENLRQHFDSN